MLNISINQVDTTDKELPRRDSYNKNIFYQQASKSPGVCSYLKSKINNSLTSTKSNLVDKSFYKRTLFSRLPITNWLVFEYKIRKNIIHDLIAGITIGIMSMPQCMGISMLANLQPVHGLYMSFFPIFIYLILGTSRHLVVGI